MLKQHLHDNWSVRAVSNFAEVPAAVRDAPIPARVPGCVHSDLLRAGLIEDPCFGLNEPEFVWIGLTDWQYSATFDADPCLFDHERIDLVCDGLDTVATIVLNGTQVAQTFNMHRGYRFDVRPMLRKGRNELTITFASPVKYADEMRRRLGPMPAITYGGHFNFIRKMACNFGWDWGPVVPTSGIWRGIRLEGWSGARIAAVRPRLLELDPDRAVVDVVGTCEFASAGTDPITDVFINVYPWWEKFGKRAECDTYAADLIGKGFSSKAEILGPQFWWPSGHGTQPLYTVQVEIFGAHSHFHDRVFRMGLRTVELDTSLDKIGRKFVVRVNGKPIFCKGFNWIPDGCFLDGACESQRVRQRIQQALDANANMLRVWGGGIYETDEFYDICDEMGILVWQDFLFACATYPEVEPIRSEVEAEARYNVARLSHHPSLVLWNGCNENIWGYRDWWAKDEQGQSRPWKELVKGKGWGAGYYLDLLPRIVSELDPSRPYWAASPWSGDPDCDNGLHPNLATHGNKHIWEVWHGADGDYSNYRKYAPRFCSEFGYQGPPNYATLMSMCEEGELCRGSRTLTLHQKSPGGDEKNQRLLAKDFDCPDDFDDWHYLLQINQSRALTAGVEWFRSRQPVCMGTLYWQLNDCWPVTSWSAIDSCGRLKPLWYATRRFYAPRLLTIQPEGGELVLFANNDSDGPWRGHALLRRISFSGRELARASIPIDAGPRSNLRAGPLPAAIVLASDPSREMIVAEIESARALWYFASDRDLNYPPPSFQPSLEREGDMHRLTLAADVLLRDVVINIDRLDPDATIDDNAVTILPDQRFTFTIRSSRELRLQELTRPPMLQCANRFGRK